MQYLSIYTPAEQRPPSQEKLAAMGKFVEEMMKSGVLLATGGLLPSANGVRVRRSGTKFAVTDGPFTETKELICGFALLKVKSKEDVIEQTRRFLDLAGDGECELRQIME